MTLVFVGRSWGNFLFVRHVNNTFQMAGFDLPVVCDLSWAATTVVTSCVFLRWYMVIILGCNIKGAARLQCQVIDF